MENFDIYKDIASRTNGDIYIGIVGPVRTGKSTFISRFMKSSILDNIVDANEKQRTIDEMPQSGAGKTVMTMQPKFVPNEAVNVKFGDDVSAKIRLIDCVGYAVDGANGFVDEGSPRMVKTPWSEEELPFEQAAEIGTRKVITEHSTIAVLVTTDGTIAGIERQNYVKAEEKVANELKSYGKPFVIVLNSRTPDAQSTVVLGESLSGKYGVPVHIMDISQMGDAEITKIIKSILLEFPVKKINFSLPKWITALGRTDEFIQAIFEKITAKTQDISKMSDYKTVLDIFDDFSDLKPLELESLDLSVGEINFKVLANENLFYKTLSKECGTEIEDDYVLLGLLKELTSAKKEYDKIKSALDMVKETGYGIVSPNIDELELAEPEIVTRGGTSSLKLKATAPSLHIMRVDVNAEVCPAVGNGESGSLVSYMMSEFENNKAEIWNKNMFGKPMNELVKDSIDSKLSALPEEVQVKMRKTITKIVNERKGGVICILL